MIENVSTQLTVFHCFAHCLLPGRAFASLYVLLFLEKEAEIGGRARGRGQKKMCRCTPYSCEQLTPQIWLNFVQWFRRRKRDGWTDGRTDGGDCNIPDTFFKKRGDKYIVFNIYVPVLMNLFNLLQIKLIKNV